MKLSECYKSSSRTYPGEKTTGGDYQPEHSMIEHELLDPLFIRYSNDSQGESNNKIPLYIGRYKGRPNPPAWIWMRCPVTAAKKIIAEIRLVIGWS